MILYLIRHGETDWNVERRCQGFSDRPLNETGRRQAEATAAHLSGIKIEAIYSSSLKRAHALGLAIAEHHDIPVHTSDALKELNQGEFEGLALSDLVEKHSEFLQRWFLDPADLKVPGGESMRELQTNTSAAARSVGTSSRQPMKRTRSMTPRRAAWSARSRSRPPTPPIQR